VSGEQQKPRRAWVWVVVGVFFFLCVIAIGGIVFSVAFFRQNMTITDTTEDNAAAEFDRVRTQFAGQKPLVQMVDGRPQYVADRATKPADSRQPLKTMHVLAWDEDEGKLVSFSLPMWLLRLKSGPIQLSAYSEGWDDRGVSFDIEDLESYGPGLLMDVGHPNEGKLLIWVK
jgi:hypothetical protein